MINAVPVNTPLLGGNELKYVSECIETGWISSEGPFIKEFEKRFSAYVGTEYGIAVSNGSAALDIAVKALGIGPGDEVIMPAFTIISPAQSLVIAGATPVLVESHPDTWNMRIEDVEAKITEKAKAILVVHIYGLPVNMHEICDIAKKHNLKVIEDAAEMHGQTIDEKMAGSFGDISIFSFYPNKLITTGEGGMILTSDKNLAERAKKLRNLAFEPDGPRFIHEEIGWNYRMTNMQAALGLAQLEQIKEFIIKKRKIGEFYQQNLEFLKEKGFSLPVKNISSASNIYWVFGIVAPTKNEKDRIVAELDNARIGTRPFFWPMHKQPVFNKMGLFTGDRFPVAEHLGSCGFYIPSGLGLTIEDQTYVVTKLREIV